MLEQYMIRIDNMKEQNMIRQEEFNRRLDEMYIQEEMIRTRND